MRPLHWIGVAAAAVVVCAAVVLVPRMTIGAQPPLPASCPQRWDSQEIGNWVPGAATGLDGVGDSLVPGSPDSALICAYPGENAHPGGEALAGSRTLTDQARMMAYDLGYLPVTTEDAGRGCTDMGGPMTNYLIRFAYPDGQVLWVGTAEEVNSCVTTTNGTVLNKSRLGPSVTAAYRTGVWELIPPKDPCDPSPGRRGQNEQMVPEGAIKVTVCRNGQSQGQTPSPAPGPEQGEQQASELAAALNALDAELGGNMCQEVGGRPNEVLQVHFGYEEGPSASVQILPNCRPSVNNGLLVGDLDDALLDRILRLAP